jgi:hypothetical protein
MRPALPAPQYYGGSATTRCPQRASHLPRTTSRLPVPMGRHRAASHVHWYPVRRGRRPATPRWPRHGPHIAVLVRASRRRNHTDAESGQVKSHDLPNTTCGPSARFPGRRRLTGLLPLVQSPLRLSVLAGGHERSGSTDPPLPCRGLEYSSCRVAAAGPAAGLDTQDERWRMCHMSHIRRFDHIGITVADLDTATAFFVGWVSRSRAPGCSWRASSWTPSLESPTPEPRSSCCGPPNGGTAARAVELRPARPCSGPQPRAGQRALPRGTGGGEPGIYRVPGFTGPQRLSLPGIDGRALR